MLDRLKPKSGSTHRRKRLGRGPGSGKGKTSGHGVKGQGKRGSGHPVRLGFEGGQMPLNIRLPKRGFTNIFRKTVEIVNVRDLAVFKSGASVDAEALAARKLIRDTGSIVKVLAEGDAPQGLTLKVNRISAKAREKITAAGGTVEILG